MANHSTPFDGALQGQFITKVAPDDLGPETLQNLGSTARTRQNPYLPTL
jgi:hypothetical protein